jgi:hypothetical protein
MGEMGEKGRRGTVKEERGTQWRGGGGETDKWGLLGLTFLLQLAKLTIVLSFFNMDHSDLWPNC